ncbi:MAG TPA: N-acetylmuramoyl-L-alanine amidase [Verrucomicrobiae bacterium]|jgi:N-acetylmuramoyl-L-alanine amidase|nr:N-acetylmuramoyl-L-alanine amidase [Verrucomicrobiae bacterium]
MAIRFGMLLDVANIARMMQRASIRNGFWIGALFFLLVSGAVALSFSSPAASQTAPAAPPPQSAAPYALPTTPATATPQSLPQTIPSVVPRAGLNVVVLDPAHGGTDPGARGTGGIRESEIVLDFAAQVRRALESQGFQVVQTRQGNENPSFDDRSALANAQSGAVFVTLHIASTGLPGTARVYVNSDLPVTTDVAGLIPWDRAQTPFQGLSRKLGDLVQGLLAQRFKGSPNTAQTAAVRQLRTTAAPAIAVEISSVVVENRADLDRMAPGVAEAIATGAVAFRPSYVVPTTTGGTP